MVSVARRSCAFSAFICATSAFICVPKHFVGITLLQHPAGDLVRLDALEERLEVALAEPLVALPLDDLEEDRADHGLGEDLQQLVLVVVLVDALAVEEDL